MSTDRLLIVNADDFGMSEGINRGIIESFQTGIVRSTSLMVRWPAARQAASDARRLPGLSVGLHFDAGEWYFDGEEWMPYYERVDLDDVDATLAELQRQLEQFHDLMGRAPTHIDSHQHVHQREAMLPGFRHVGTSLGIPVRHADNRVHYVGSFYGQTETGESLPELIGVSALLKCLANLNPGTSELCCHPGYPEGLNSMYRTERTREIDALCEPAVRQEIARQQIRLCSFAQL